MGGFKAITIYTLKEYFREKIILFWAILWPLFWIFMIAYVFIPPGFGSPVTLEIGIVNYDTSNTTLNGTLLVEVMNKTKYMGNPLFNTILYNNESMLFKDLRKGRLDAGIVIPDKWGVNTTYGQGELKIYIGARNAYSASITRGILQGFFKEFSKEIAYKKIDVMINYISISLNYTDTSPYTSNESFINMLRKYFAGIAEPFKTNYSEIMPEVYANRSSIIGYYVIGAIGMMYLYMGFSIGASFIVSLKERGILYRLLSTPLREYHLIFGGLASNILFILLSTIIIIFTGVFIAGAHIVWDPMDPVHWIIPFMFLALLLISLGIGALISPLAKTSNGAVQLGTTLGLISSFTTRIWLHPEWLPSWFKFFSDIYPATWCVDVIRGIIVYDTSLTELVPKIIGVFIATTILLVLAIIIWRKHMAKYVEF